MRVLFVCSGNACRSPLAEALLKKFSPEIDVDSAGTHAFYRIVDLTKRYAEQEGVTLCLKEIPEDVDTKNLTDYDLIVAMEPKHKKAIVERCPQCADKIVVWNIDDPYQLTDAHAWRIFERMKSKVAHLAKSVE